jgi:hypothetical protein
MDSVNDHPDGWGFPIRKSSDQSVLATPRSLSQPATSFIASQCQGIRQTPLLCLTLTFCQRNNNLAIALRKVNFALFRLVPCRGRTPQQNGHDLPVGVAALRNARNSTLPDFQTSSDLRCQRTNCVPIRWWRQTGSNRRPPACKAGALPTELCPRLEISVVSVSSAMRAGTTARVEPIAPLGGPGRI